MMWIAFAIGMYAVWKMFTRTPTPPKNKDWQPRKTPQPSHHHNDDFTPGESSIPVRATIRIEYGSADGEITQREIVVSRYDPALGTLYARCLLRNENRTFRIDRIKKAFDAETGAEINGIRSFIRKKRMK